MYKVYKINFPNGKSYIGQTKKDINIRFNEHKYNTTTDLHRPIIMAMRKYSDQASIETLETDLSPEEADYLEKYYIRFYDSLSEANGYNLSSGGNSGSIMSESGKKRHKEKMKKHYDDPEYVKRITKHLVDRKYTDPEFYYKQSEYSKKNWLNNRDKMVELAKEHSTRLSSRVNRAKARGFKGFICVETNEFFSCYHEAAVKFGATHKDSIYKAVKGIRKSYKGFHFKEIK